MVTGWAKIQGLGIFASGKRPGNQHLTATIQGNTTYVGGPFSLICKGNSIALPIEASSYHITHITETTVPGYLRGCLSDPDSRIV